MFEVKCEKCECGYEGLGTLFVSPMRLVGGVTTVLCPSCTTKWNEFAVAHPAYHRLRELECVRNSIVHTRELSADRSDPALHQVLEEIRKCEATLHEEGLEWIGRED